MAWLFQKDIIYFINCRKKWKTSSQASMNQHLITLQSSDGFHPRILASGQIKKYDNDFIYVEIVEEEFADLQKYSEKQCFDIRFNMNRVGYQLQHRALDYVRRHSLHSILINNKLYARQYDFVNDVSGSFGNSLNSLSGKFAERLNDEQRIAVKFITKSDNLQPYLLFGPAG